MNKLLSNILRSVWTPLCAVKTALQRRDDAIDLGSIHVVDIF